MCGGPECVGCITWDGGPSEERKEYLPDDDIYEDLDTINSSGGFEY